MYSDVCGYGLCHLLPSEAVWKVQIPGWIDEKPVYLQTRVSCSKHLEGTIEDMIKISARKGDDPVVEVRPNI